MTDEIKNLLERAQKARATYQLGIIDRQQAEKEIQPYITMYNKKSKDIAKKYNVRPKLISFAVFLR